MPDRKKEGFQGEREEVAGDRREGSKEEFRFKARTPCYFFRQEFGMRGTGEKMNGVGSSA